MSISSWNAGIIRPVPVAPAGPYQDGAAPGVWTLDQVAYWQKQGLWPIAGNAAPIGLFMGGFTGAVRVASIDRILITTLANATDFGDLTLNSLRGPAASSATRAVKYLANTSSGVVNTLEYVTISTPGNAIDFGDLTVSRPDGTAFSNSTRGVWAAGDGRNVIDYITIATTGNATDFGDCVAGFNDTPGGLASPTRGVIGGGQSSTLGDYSNVIQYVTIATTGNAVDFGDLTVGRHSLTGASNATRGLFAGGNPAGYTNVIDYITIATTGNATDFGDLTSAIRGLSGLASLTRAVFAGGSTGSVINTIAYVTIDTTGNAVDFGDLTAALEGIGQGASNAHGGL